MLYENFPHFLDSILLAFSEDYNNSKSLDKLKSIVFKEELLKGYDLNEPDENLKRISTEIFTYSEYLKYGLDFLNQEGLISYDNIKRDNEDSIKITSNGFFKIKTQGFESKIKDDKELINLQKNTFKVAILSLIVSIISVCVSTYFSTKTTENEIYNNVSKTSSNCNHKNEISSNDFQFQSKDSIKVLVKKP